MPGTGTESPGYPMLRNLPRILLPLITLALPSAVLASEASATPKLRTVVMTDIGGDPDDQQSLVRFLLYCNEWDVEGLYATPRWRGDINNPEKIHERIDAYEQVLPNLRKHASGYPDADKLRDLVKRGLLQRGMEAVGEGKSTAASNHLIEVIDRPDPRPVWVQVWGAPGDLAQALWDVRATRTPAEVADFVAKIRVYDIGGQDETGAWMLNQFPDLHWIRSVNQFFGMSPFEDERFQPLWERQFLNHQYPDGREAEERIEWTGDDYERVFGDTWVDENVQENHGPFGPLYPDRHWLHEGDTPAFLHLIPNGLADPDRHWWGAWGGRFNREKTLNPLVFRRDQWEKQEPYQPFRAYTGAVDAFWSEPEQREWRSHWASLFRWREAFQNDFSARMDWCVAETYADANHNPTVVLEGDSSGAILHREVSRGEAITLSAKGSDDPDGDVIAYRWWHYEEPGGTLGGEATLDLEGADSESLTVRVPEDWPAEVSEAHIILEVTDSGSPTLYGYRRMILTIE